MLPLLGLFGGTFDPIHNGHISVARGLLNCLPFQEIQLIPCRYPAHNKHPKGSISDRLAMIKLAIANVPQLSINTMEVKRKTVSYTIDTIKQCRQIFPDHSLCLILATDVFSHLNQWQQWQNLLNYCHFIIVERPQFSLSKASWMLELLSKYKTENEKDLNYFSTGKILFKKASPSIITATEIRSYLSKKNYQAVTSMLPKSVLYYIQKHHLYLNACNNNQSKFRC